jgi:N-acetylglucosaminyldiphosphoundecaprenol N-acetyl-beta-D-mannosaminyltransferase
VTGRGPDDPARETASLASRSILGMRVDATSYADASRRIMRWAAIGESRYVCVAAVNNVMHAYDDPAFGDVMNDADLVTPDGMPLVWGLRRLGIPSATRVYGPDLMPRLLTEAQARGIPVGFLGGSARVLDALLAAVGSRWPDLSVEYAWSPPFTALDAEEDVAVVDAINDSGARILFVGLGCPKQETWMAAHRDAVRAVMVGVGAAFDFLAGEKRQAPASLRRLGLEWLFRLVTEPRRLARRYVRQNPRFALLFAAQLAGAVRRRANAPAPIPNTDATKETA